MLELKGGQVTLGANWEKFKCYVLVYTLHTHAVSSSVSYTCFEHLFTMKLTQMVEIGALAETDINSVFKILWLNPLLVLGSSIDGIIMQYFTAYLAIGQTANY